MSFKFHVSVLCVLVIVLTALSYAHLIMLRDIWLLAVFYVCCVTYDIVRTKGEPAGSLTVLRLGTERSACAQSTTHELSSVRQ